MISFIIYMRISPQASGRSFLTDVVLISAKNAPRWDRAEMWKVSVIIKFICDHWVTCHLYSKIIQKKNVIWTFLKCDYQRSSILCSSTTILQCFIIIQSRICTCINPSPDLLRRVPVANKYSIWWVKLKQWAMCFNIDANENFKKWK